MIYPGVNGGPIFIKFGTGHLKYGTSLPDPTGIQLHFQCTKDVHPLYEFQSESWSEEQTLIAMHFMYPESIDFFIAELQAAKEALLKFRERRTLRLITEHISPNET